MRLENQINTYITKQPKHNILSENKGKLKPSGIAAMSAEMPFNDDAHGRLIVDDGPNIAAKVGGNGSY